MISTDFLSVLSISDVWWFVTIPNGLKTGNLMGNCLKSRTADSVSLLQMGSNTSNSAEQLEQQPSYVQVIITFQLFVQPTLAPWFSRLPQGFHWFHFVRSLSKCFIHLQMSRVPLAN